MTDMCRACMLRDFRSTPGLLDTLKGDAELALAGRLCKNRAAVLRPEPMTLLTLRTGRLGAELAPSAGGSVARFTCGDVDILRPMAAEAIASGKGNNAALYPLVP